ncbi:MAG: heavy metal-binding domain-containing protein [bacterium]
MELFNTKAESVKERKGLVTGTAIYSEKFTDSIKSAIEVKKGGFIDKFTESTDGTISEAINKMVAEAKVLNANAIEGIRINVQNIVSNSSDYITAVTVCGTAIVL